LYHNGTAFVNWTQAADYTAIANLEQANSLFLAGTKVYDSDFDLVTSADVFTGEATFYLYAPVDTFLKDNVKKVMEEVTTIKNASSTFFTLEAQSITKVTVYIWLEGQDVDCEDTIASHAFSVAFKFNATYVA
ncbi:MAG: hypothetical protein IKV38_00410, partial [Clostridia bacterium]|nr:hypothetical protein [Clostridia bacterium]